MTLNDTIRKVSSAVQLTLRTFFFRIGYIVSGAPYRTMLACVFIIVLCSIGIFTSFFSESREDKLWVPQGTLALTHRDWIDNNYVSGVRPEFIIVTSKDGNGDDVATTESLLELVSILRTTRDSITYTSDSGETFNTTSLCQEVSDGVITTCQTRSILDLFYDRDFLAADFLETVEAKLQSITNDDVKTALNQGTTYSTWNGAALSRNEIIGGINTDSDGNIVSVGALRVLLLMQNNEVVNGGESKDLIAEGWEREWLLNIRESEDSYTSISYYARAFVSESDAAGDSISGDVSLFIIGYTLLMIYVKNIMGELNAVKSRVALAAMGFVSVGLAFGATVGISSAAGMFYGPVHQILPLLLVGIGIDDAFVIVTAFDATDESRPLRIRVATALSHAGAAVTVTSVTNSCAFFIGSLTEIPALRYFAIWAGIGILFDFFLQTTFFVACLTLDAKRQEEKRVDMFCCIKKKNVKETNLFGLKPGVLMRFFSEKFAPVILNSKVRAVTLVTVFGVFITCGIGMAQLKQEFQPEFFYIEGTPVKEFEDVNSIYFGDASLPFDIYTGSEIDYANTDVQQRMTLLFKEYVVSDPFYKENTIDSWYLNFRAFANVSNNDDETIPEDQFYPTLATFLQTDGGSRFFRQLKFDTEGKLSATRSSADFIDLLSNDEEVDAMLSMRDSIAKAGFSPETGAFPFSFPFIFFEQYAVLLQEAVTNIVASLAVVLVISLLLIGNPFVAFITLVGVGLSVVDILGIMYYTGIELNSISVINLSVAVGLTIDFSAHIGLAFMESVGTKAERATDALRNLGPPLLHGGVSTFLAISVLVVADSYVFRIFFKMFVLIIGLGMFHGMVAVPQLLSLVGPDGYFETVEEQEAEEVEIYNKVVKNIGVDSSSDAPFNEVTTPKP